MDRWIFYHGAMAIDPESLSIVLHPEPALKTVATTVSEITDEVIAVAQRMLGLMAQAEGIGLAAPQVGLSWRMFVTRHPEGPEVEGGLVFVNPVIEVVDPTLEEDIEGCLSLPGIDVLVRRPIGIRVTATDLNGDEFAMEWHDHFGRVCQHETDHLDGVLIIDRMNTMDRLRNRKAIRALEQA